MYKVVKIDRCAVTSFINLLNLKTGTVEHGVFDDSRVVSDNNFDFMREGEIYDCKMELFGDFDHKKTDSNVLVTILESDIIIGNTKYFKVSIGSDIYYILMSDAKDFEATKNMYYHFTRTDLIQVDDVIHADCL